MRVTALELANFRNYAALRFEPTDGVCIFVGANAQGKSNLLEALSLLSTGKSFRAAREADLVRSGAPLARVAARVATKSGEVQAACIVTRVGEGARKRFVRNGRSVPYSQFLGGINAVTFMPFDLQLVTGAPALRRRLLNAALSQSDRHYYHKLATYSQVLMQKNASLKAPSVDRSLLATYNEQLAEVGSHIMSARAVYIRKLAHEAAAVHARWVGAAPELSLSYVPSLALHDETPDAIAQALQQALTSSLVGELARRTSLVGPHRDDLVFVLGEDPLARYGSQGQQRTAVLALKAAEYALLAQAVGEPPLLLLDDVFSELDAARRLAFLSSIQNLEQAFVTATDMQDFQGVAATVYHIENGNIEQPVAGMRARA
ncbi:MAG: DNA replication/repair protein RecF [Candidatus Eremiobacteraeota bacterium]|nr:DNA replication/repair protein RecF [Candidatus Eremiobacteraeota bacterium]